MADPGNDRSPGGDAAEQAVAAGDLASAANHLRATLARQEAELGPAHPDLASTLNNLGVVHERMGDFAAAERCYRRAFAMVTAAFPAGHPFVDTSRQNLAAFCEARGIPFGPVAPPAPEPLPPPAVEPNAPPVIKPIATPEPAARPERAVPPEPAVPPRRIEELAPQSSETTPSPKPQAPKRLRRLVIVSIIAVIAIAAVWAARRERADRAATSPPASVVTQTPPVPAPPAAASPPAIAPSPATSSVSSPPAGPGRSATRDNAASVSVVDAKLCTELSRSGQWTCSPVSDPVSPGMLYFYTRVASAVDATVVHRWYHDERLEKSSELQIRANASAGYRTYSRFMIDPGRSGQYRVEVRTADGKVLQETRFTVR